MHGANQSKTRGATIFMQRPRMKNMSKRGSTMQGAIIHRWTATSVFMQQGSMKSTEPRT